MHEPFPSNSVVVVFANNDLPPLYDAEAGFSEEARTEVVFKVTFDHPSLLEPHLGR